MMPILPGSTIGVLGSGQLGRMFALEARRMGYRVHTLSPDSDTPTGQVADVEINAAYEDLDQVRAFARNVDAVTFEFENVPSATVDAIEALVPVRPSGSVLHTTQHRVREKVFLANAGIPAVAFRVVKCEADLLRAIEDIGCPAVLKTAGFGYDGKGQVKIEAAAEAARAWQTLGGAEAVLEAFADLDCELSVVAARGLDGRFASFGVAENRHANHILDVSICPARLPSSVAEQAVEITRAILTALSAVGVVCVEFFLTRAGRLLVNEIAPRPHNSGHLTLDACLTSQFEQQLRAVCGLPLGSTEQFRPAAMANLLGDLWSGGEPDWAAAVAQPEVKLHLYGKLEPRAARKMGHITALGATPENALQSAVRARNLLSRKS
jgi:5-(carboxyamino)imidazole ribonucleotide synthase